jgi:tetratricopeptide (TPR) repeat protein
MVRTKVRKVAVLSAECVPSSPQSPLHRVFALAAAASAFALFASNASVSMAQIAPQAAPQVAPAAKATVKKAAKAKVKPTEPGADGEAVATSGKKDPAEAQRTIENGIKLYQTGKNDAAIQTISAGLAGGNLPPALMGRALYNRGMAYRKAGKPAQAISDLTSALWLKGGLADADRSDALQQRSQAYREAGLPDQTDDNGKVAGTAPNRPRTASAATSDTGNQSATPTPQPAPASNGGGFFASLFGGGSAPPAQPVTQPPAAPTQPATSAWTSEVRERKAGTVAAANSPSPASKSAVTASVAATEASPSPATRIADGKFRARVALARTKADADAIALRLKAQFGQILASREPEIAQTTFGGMGTFFQVRVGPYATKAEATVACSKLKGDGLDCVPVDQ